MATEEDNETNCPLCGDPARRVSMFTTVLPGASGLIIPSRNTGPGNMYDCPRCGEFVITRSDEALLTTEHSDQRRTDLHKISALLREQQIAGLPPFWIQFTDTKYWPLTKEKMSPVPSERAVAIAVTELLDRWPRTVADKLNRSLCNLARLSPTGGHTVEVGNSDWPLVFGSNPAELRYHFECLVEQGYLEDAVQSARGCSAVLIAKGWARFEELSRGTSSRANPAFVAMSFGSSEDGSHETMDTLYKVIQGAVEAAGYKAIRADLDAHNDFIMDRVLAGIRRAPFVVADFTGHRNGVYWEAGYARGLGIPVIHTCKEADFDQAHFDIKQINTIRWDEPANLKEKLKWRILSTIGEGPFPPPVDEGGNE